MTIMVSESNRIIQPKPDNRKYSKLILHIEDGTIKIAKFQREFVWKIQKPAIIFKTYP